MACKPIILGRVSGVFGIKGWVKVHSHTRPADNILQYPTWLVGNSAGWPAYRVLDARAQSKTLVALLADELGSPIPDRDAASRIVGRDIAVPRSRMPALPAGEYYWFDLIGLDVYTREGEALGQVRNMMETGANDVLVVAGERERLIPFVVDYYVHRVEIVEGYLVVDWDPDA